MLPSQSKRGEGYRAWEDDGGTRAVIYEGRLSITGKPSMTADDGTVALGIDAPWVAELQAVVETAQRLKWNALDGSDEYSDLIVERESWSRFRRALGRLGGW